MVGNEINFTTLRYHFSGRIGVNKSIFCMLRKNLCGGTLREMEVWVYVFGGAFAVSVKWAGKN